MREIGPSDRRLELARNLALKAEIRDTYFSDGRNNPFNPSDRVVALTEGWIGGRARLLAHWIPIHRRMWEAEGSGLKQMAQEFFRGWASGYLADNRYILGPKGKLPA